MKMTINYKNMVQIRDILNQDKVNIIMKHQNQMKIEIKIKYRVKYRKLSIK